MLQSNFCALSLILFSCSISGDRSSRNARTSSVELNSSLFNRSWISSSLLSLLESHPRLFAFLFTQASILDFVDSETEALETNLLAAVTCSSNYLEVGLCLNMTNSFSFVLSSLEYPVVGFSIFL